LGSCRSTSGLSAAGADADGLHDLLKCLKPLYPSSAVFVDSIYDRLATLHACFLFSLALVIVRCAVGASGFIVQPRRLTLHSLVHRSQAPT
jgi:hypothetical protein